jgi:hypothetical protein
MSKPEKTGLGTVNVIYILGVLFGTVLPKIARAVLPTEKAANQAFLIYLFGFLIFTGVLPFLGSRYPETRLERFWYWAMRFLFPTVAAVGIYITLRLFAMLR